VKLDYNKMEKNTEMTIHIKNHTCACASLGNTFLSVVIQTCAQVVIIIEFLCSL
jgi:hypothetical protein